jgi:hypothetical protein
MIDSLLRRPNRPTENALTELAYAQISNIRANMVLEDIKRFARLEGKTIDISKGREDTLPPPR